jgi:hypothetical protein
MPEEGREYLEEWEKDYLQQQEQTDSRDTTNNRYGRIREVEEGHGRVQQRRLALHRKSMVFDLSSKGYNQHRISAILHVSQALVSLDLAQLRKDAMNSMKSYLEEKLPLIYQECYEGISQVISRSWEMINDVNTPNQTRAQLLALVADATQTKLDISCGGEVIENGIKYAQQNIKNRFVAITKPEEILHSSSEEQQQPEDDNLTKKDSKGNDDNNNDSNNNNSLSDTDNVVGNNNNIGSNGNENTDDNVIANDNDSNKEEDYTTDPFDSYYSSFSSSSSSFSSSSTSSQQKNTDTDNNDSSSNRRTKNSVF